MRTVYKYDIQIGPDVTFKLPPGASLLHTACQGDPAKVQIWVETVSETTSYVERTFRIVGTGQDIERGEEEDLKYVGTALAAGGELVWHVYEVLS